MSAVIDKLIEAVMKREGGYVNNAVDRGGPTNFGVTAATLGRWRGYSVPAETIEVQALTYTEAKQILTKEYVLFPGLEEKSELLQEAILDLTIHSGQTKAITILQRALHVPVDGFLGPATKAAMIATDPKVLYRRLTAERLKFIASMVSQNPSQLAFLKGWCNRIADFIEREV